MYTLPKRFSAEIMKTENMKAENFRAERMKAEKAFPFSKPLQ